MLVHAACPACCAAEPLNCCCTAELLRRCSRPPRLTFPAYTPGGRPLESVDLLLICDSYLGLDQQYTIPLGAGSGTGGSAAQALPLVGQAARQDQQEARRRHAATEGEQQQQQGGEDVGAGAPMDVDAPQSQQQQRAAQQQQPGPAGDVLPQRAPRRPRGAAARQPLDQAEATLDCRLDAGGGS